MVYLEILRIYSAWWQSSCFHELPRASKEHASKVISKDKRISKVSKKVKNIATLDAVLMFLL